VLKAYQGEINKLIARAKFAEGSFLTVYKALAAAPDPVPLLQEAMDESHKAAALEAENREMKTRLAEYDKEFQNLKNQEYTVRKLEAENKEYERKLEQRVSEVVQENKKTMNDEVAELRRQFSEQERLHQQRLTSAKDALTKALHAHDKTQSQLFDATAKAENVAAAKDSEEQLVTAEVERLNGMLAVAKREIVRSHTHARSAYVLLLWVCWC
jgi:homeobox protein cut-like